PSVETGIWANSGDETGGNRAKSAVESGIWANSGKPGVKGGIWADDKASVEITLDLSEFMY
ncbi:MAG: hypothetical protein KDD75_00625, partial [Caldilineaceae bacterium]|nr:hypothetical protein [Caldilineaceae bacterium]